MLQLGSKLLGLVTLADYALVDDLSAKVEDIMVINVESASQGM